MSRLAALLLTLLATGAPAAAPTLDDVLLDRTIFGPEVEVDDLRGRVVLLEFWGIT